MNIVNFISSLLFIVIIIGCSDTINEPNDNLIGKNYIKKIISNSENYTTFTYDKECRLIARESIINGFTVWKSNYYYNVDGFLIKEEIYNTIVGFPQYSLTNFIYSNNGIEKAETYLKNNDGVYEQRSYKLFEFDNQNRIIQENIYTPDNIKVKCNQFIYKIDGNIEQIKYLDNDKIYLITEYEYDDKLNPFYKFSFPEVSVTYSCKNNVLSSISTFINDYHSGDELTHNIYEYNESNYPIYIETKIENKQKGLGYNSRSKASFEYY